MNDITPKPEYMRKDLTPKPDFPPKGRYKNAQPVLEVSLNKKDSWDGKENICLLVSNLMDMIDSETDDVHKVRITLNGEGEIYFGFKKELLNGYYEFLVKRISEYLGCEYEPNG